MNLACVVDLDEMRRQAQNEDTLRIPTVPQNAELHFGITVAPSDKLPLIEDIHDPVIQICYRFL